AAVRIPALADTPVRQDAEQRELATTVEPTAETAPRAIRLSPAERPAQADLAPSEVDPVQKSAESLVSQPIAMVRTPRAADRVDTQAAPESKLVPLSGKLEPGRLTAPPSLFERSVEMRPRLVKAFGGSDESEAAVAKALRFLAASQERDGRWSKINKDVRPGKKVRTSDVDVAVTSLATLCYLACQHTHTQDGPYRETVQKALDWLIEKQKDNGDLTDKAGNHSMYNHAIATLALAEAAGITGDKKVKAAAIKAAEFIIYAQNRQHGGWRYTPKHRDGDTSVFGWQVMGLRSAELLGLKIPGQTRRGARKWLAYCSSGKGNILAAYQRGKPTPVMTAEAVFSRILLGESLSEQQVQTAAKFIFSRGPTREKNYYYWYYGSLALMQLRDDHWEKWNSQLRDHLVKRQEGRGRLAGSWEPDGKWANRGGRIYSTAMATMTLEVYYRYLPMLKAHDTEN
ncbi:MAG: hypothetical protein ACLFV7_08635, partial [Phycisphaerae bacterium]